MNRLRDLLAADLYANAAGHGLRAAIYAFFLNPGFSAISVHRLAQALHRAGWARSSEVVWAWNTIRTGCHLHIDSEIGPGLMLPHPVSIVFGRGAIIEEGVCIYQGVTLGRDREGGYPTIRRGVTIYPNAVLVGAIEVGADAVIGATVFLTESVGPAALVGATQEKMMRYRSSVSAIHGSSVEIEE